MATEKRLIDANSLLATMKEMYCDGCTNYNGVRCRACDFDSCMGDIDDAPTVDAVEVVRCKDCKKGHPELAPNGGVWCALWNHVFHDDGFCSKGERRSTFPMGIADKY